MPTLTFDLKFDADDDHPGIAFAQVIVKEWTTDNAGHFAGAPIITAQAAGPEELDGYIDMLKDELEQVRKKAHHAFANQHDRWQKL